MPRDSELASRVRSSLRGIAECEEKAMFSGIAFMLDDHMLVAASKRGLLVRVGPERYQEALARPGTRPMEMKGRALTGYVFVDPATLTESVMKGWLRMAVTFVRTLPPKATAPKRRRKTAAK
jgi:hypothetical protein